MKKIIIFYVFVMLSSCKGENDLEQVQIPDPEVETTQLAYGNPGDVKF